MHAVMMSSVPPLLYWRGATLDVIHGVGEARARGTPVFFTIDAGAQVKIVCAPGTAASFRDELQQMPGVREVIETGLGPPAQVMEGGA